MFLTQGTVAMGPYFCFIFLIEKQLTEELSHWLILAPLCQSPSHSEAISTPPDKSEWALEHLWNCLFNFASYCYFKYMLRSEEYVGNKEKCPP